MASSAHERPRVGVVVVTHEGAAHCLCGAARAILGPARGAVTPLPDIESVDCGMSEDTMTIVNKIKAACDRVDRGAGILLLVDVHGSTPFNAAMSMLDGTRPAEVLCGVNLPMLIKLSTVDRIGLGPTQVAETLREIGRRSIRLGSEMTGKVAVSSPTQGQR